MNCLVRITKRPVRLRPPTRSNRNNSIEVTFLLCHDHAALATIALLVRPQRRQSCRCLYWTFFSPSSSLMAERKVAIERNSAEATTTEKGFWLFGRFSWGPLARLVGLSGGCDLEKQQSTKSQRSVCIRATAQQRNWSNRHGNPTGTLRSGVSYNRKPTDCSLTPAPGLILTFDSRSFFFLSCFLS